MTEVNKNIDNGKTKKTEILQKTWVVCALALVCTFLWGSASPCIKLGYALFEIPSGETWTQVLFAGMRFVLAGILTVLIGSWQSSVSQIRYSGCFYPHGGWEKVPRSLDGMH